MKLFVDLYKKLYYYTDIQQIVSKRGENLRKWLKELRDNNNLSQYEMAKKIGITSQFYNFIENGKRRPSIETAKKIAEILNFDWTLFFEE